MRKVVGTDGQALIDLALQEYGSVEGILPLLLNNDFASVEATLLGEASFNVDDIIPDFDGKNLFIQQEFARRSYRVNGGNKYVAPKIIEPEALTFINTLPLTDTTDKDYVNCIVSGLKSANLFTPHLFIKPYVGATAGKHKFNLMNPITDVAGHPDSYFGGLTHNSLGVTGNGSTGYINTNFNASAKFSSKNRTYILYANDLLENSYDFGALNGAFVGDSFASRFGGQAYPSIKSISNGGPFTVANSSGCWIITRQDMTIRVYRNGVLVKTFTVSNDIEPNVNLILAAAWVDTSVQYFSSRTYKYFAAMDQFLTDSQAAAYSAVIVAAQTLKGRA